MSYGDGLDWGRVGESGGAGGRWGASGGKLQVPLLCERNPTHTHPPSPRLGVRDAFNLCGDAEGCKKICAEISREMLMPGSPRSEHFDEIAGAYIEGLNLLFLTIPVLSVESTVAYVWWGLGVSNAVADLSWLDYLRFLGYRATSAFLCSWPGKACNACFSYLLRRAQPKMEARVRKGMERMRRLLLVSVATSTAQDGGPGAQGDGADAGGGGRWAAGERT